MANTSKSTKKTAKRAGTTSSGSRSNGARRTASRTASSRNAGREENDEYTTAGRTSAERNSGDRERSYEDDYRNSRYRGMTNDGEEGDLSRRNPGEDTNSYRTNQQDRPYGDDWGYREDRTPYGENWGNEERSSGQRGRNNEGRSSSYNQGWSQRDDDRRRSSYDDEQDFGRGRRQERSEYDDNRGYGQSSQRDRSYSTNQERYMDHDRSWGKGGHEEEWQDNRNRRVSYDDDQYGRQGTGYNEGFERRGYSRNDEWSGQQNRRGGGMSLYNQDDSDMRRGRNESDWNMGRSRYEDEDRGYDRNRDSYSGRQSFNQGSRYMDDRRSEGYSGRRDEGRNWDDYQEDRRNRRDRF